MSELPQPFWSDDLVTLYHGDAMQLLPMLAADGKNTAASSWIDSHSASWPYRATSS